MNDSDGNAVFVVKHHSVSPNTTKCIAFPRTDNLHQPATSIHACDEQSIWTQVERRPAGREGWGIHEVVHH